MAANILKVFDITSLYAGNFENFVQESAVTRTLYRFTEIVRRSFSVRACGF